MLAKPQSLDDLTIVPGNATGQVDFDAFPPIQFDPEIQREIRRNTRNGRAGSRLVSQTDRVRIWLIEMEPGDRLEFHRHVLDYFWTTTTAGRGRSRYPDGRVVDTDYSVGATKNYKMEKGGSFMHDLENIGDTTLSFVTVEFLDSANTPLTL
jgi:hypothetical protein